jgi:hypothetical protein
MCRRNARGGQHGSAKCEWESKDRVLPLNHFQRNAEIVEDGHGKIVARRFSVLGSQKTKLGRRPVNPFHGINLSRQRRFNTENRELGTENCF